ncbi:MAG: hypothetical protein H7Y20_12750 [Bryobacteraceae bacterium]|nr:hypothetical protein [Bryobacteraceae bacterium]
MHPFHPLYGQEFEQFGTREGLPEDRLYFEHNNGRAASIPKHFTNLGPVDPVVVMGRSLCLFRVADLVTLCSLIAANPAAEGSVLVKGTMPHV